MITKENGNKNKTTTLTTTTYLLKFNVTLHETKAKHDDNYVRMYFDGYNFVSLIYLSYNSRECVSLILISANMIDVVPKL